MHEGGNLVIAVLVGGACLGLMLVTALWFYERLDSWKSAMSLVAIMAVANCSFLFGKYVPHFLQQEKELPLLGLTKLEHSAFFFPTCVIAFCGFAFILLHRRNAVRTIPVAIVSAVVGTLVFVFIVEQQRSAWFSPLSAAGLGPLWQVTLVSFLGLSLWLGQISIRPELSAVESSPSRPTASARNGLISIGILVATFVAVQLWTSALIYQERRKNAEHQAHMRAALAHAPSRENLPLLEQEKIEKIFPADVAGSKPSPADVKMLPDEHVLPAGERSNPRALYPRRYFYKSTYFNPIDGESISVEVTAFPTTDWASYYVRSRPIFDRTNVWERIEVGNNFYQFDNSFDWVSGNKVISLDCRLARQPMSDAFLRAYLEKYPSSL